MRWGDFVTVGLPVEADGEYEISGYFMRDPAGAQVEVSAPGRVIGRVDAFQVN